jgi:hypothetical protein
LNNFEPKRVSRKLIEEIDEEKKEKMEANLKQTEACALKLSLLQSLIE